MQPQSPQEVPPQNPQAPPQVDSPELVQQPISQPYTEPPVSLPPKKSYKGLVIALVVSSLVLIVAVVVGIVLFLNRDSSDTSNGLTNNSSAVTPADSALLANYDKVTGDGYSFSLPKGALRENESTGGYIKEQYTYTIPETTMLVAVLVEESPSPSTFLANGAVNTIISRFKQTPNYKSIKNQDATVLGSSQAYEAEVLYGTDTSYYLIKSAVLDDEVTTVTLQIIYPEFDDSEVRSTAEAILGSLSIDG